MAVINYFDWLAVVFFVFSLFYFMQIPFKFTGKKYWMFLFLGAALLMAAQFSQILFAFNVIELETTIMVADWSQVAGALALAFGSYLLFTAVADDDLQKQKILGLIKLAKVKYAKREIGERTLRRIVTDYEEQLLEIEARLKKLD